MRVRRSQVALAVLVANVLACQLILGIGDDPYRFAPPPATPGCPHGARPRRLPDASDEGPKATYIFAMRRFDLSGRTATGEPAGYDLDGVCTCDPRDTSPRRGATSCVPPASSARDGGCDYDAGIDNAMAEAFQNLDLLGGGQNDLREQIACGRENLLLFLDNYNGEADDPDVLVSLLPSFGIHEGDAAPDARACVYEDTPAGQPVDSIPPRWDGNDRWSTRQSEVRSDRPSLLLPGWVSGFHLVMDARAGEGEEDERTVPLVFGHGTVSLGGPILTATLVKTSAGSFQVEDGIFTGRTPVDDVLRALGAFRVATSISASGYLCGAPLFGAVQAFACSAADAVSPASRDFSGDPCNAVSLVLQFSAEPAKLGGVFEPDSGAPPCPQSPSCE
jgi:hypothetical protein